MSTENLSISNFKSIKNLDISCGKINVFIGEPNTGKSNILEALGLLSFMYYGDTNDINDFVRNERILNLFHDENIESPIRINTTYANSEFQYKNSVLRGISTPITGKVSGRSEFLANYSSITQHQRSGDWPQFQIKYYKYTEKINYTTNNPDSLLPATGRNLVSLILTNKQLKQFVDEILKPYGLRMVIKPQEGKLEIIKLTEDILISYPYELLSDTLKRVIFHMAAILSNKDSTLVFEEPESHAFPYHTKYLAEKIALDDRNNQYFIATHNPYFLITLLEKTPLKDIQVFLTYFEEYQTKVKTLSENQKERLLQLDADVFFQLEDLLEQS
ncbi:MAG: AAA family ATPase [Dehalococcoidales bacterium]|nr:AAA family ATPase [Dehalococcoidales bacterium]